MEPHGDDEFWAHIRGECEDDCEYCRERRLMLFTIELVGGPRDGERIELPYDDIKSEMVFSMFRVTSRHPNHRGRLARFVGGLLNVDHGVFYYRFRGEIIRSTH
ncbi:MAG TPA: hypothetical protein VMX74_13550 [Pirellulales bacterium]|nr:hypothetical protein [Pirellulales bacterium]